ncbi:MAG TPA: DUF397 domain-containing protein [Streptosporangiaceae bacterium]|nr:DUF397 domain-containing protein [Streptosporangiaceae bacterium]
MGDIDGVRWDTVQWRKSSYSGSNGGACVEVAVLPDASRAVRDSKDPDGPNLAFAPEEWQDFTAAVRTGQFDLR